MTAEEMNDWVCEINHLHVVACHYRELILLIIFRVKLF